MIEPLRTSPPPRILLACSSPGGTVTRTCLPVVVERRIVQLLPVRTKPRSSSSTAPWSQPVLASAPMKTRAPAPQSPAFPRAVILDHDPIQAVFSRELSHPGADQQFDVRGVRNPGRRGTSTCSCLELLPYEQVNPPRASRQKQRRLAAELPPPTIATSSPSHLCASASVAA